MGIVEILRTTGAEIAEGHKEVLQMIRDKAGPPGPSLCSGHGVFPNGKTCPGCKDCKKES